MISSGMRPGLSWGIAVCLALCALGARAANPDDLDLVLRLTRDPPVFHAGEPIEFEISYATRTEGKYRGAWTNPAPGLGVATPHISPTTGLADLLSLRGGASAGSILSTVGNLDPQYPVTEKADLAGWYRFEKGGHYELRISSPQVSRIKSLEEGGGVEPISLESNPVEFDVLPRDAAWEAQELTAATQNLNADAPAHLEAIHRLALLDTPASIRELMSLFLAVTAPVGDATVTSSPGDYEVYRGLGDSARPELIIPLVETALEDPLRRPNATLVSLLVDLQVRQELGTPPIAVPEDPAQKKEWEAEWAKRNKRFQDYVAQANVKLLASIRQRSGPQRNAALFQAWQMAERANNPPEEAPWALMQLRQEVLASARELPPDDAVSFVTEVWNRKSMPREQLLPLLRYLALSAGLAPKERQALIQTEVYPLWCEEALRECNDAILADAVKPDSPLFPITILLLKEAEHPELDAPLKERLAAATLKDYVAAQKTGALVLRAGSRNLLPAVKDALVELAGKPGADCEIQAYLVNYQFRFAPKDARQYLRAALQDKQSSCGWFGFLGQMRYSDDLIPSAIEALESPNPTTAASAALFLGAHGPADVEDVLWRNLEAFWDKWRDRAAELESAVPGLSGPAAATHLEQALVNALLHGANWKLTVAGQERLRTGCLTDDCRQVAAGEMSLGG
jgi:hypothetical protein